MKSNPLVSLLFLTSILAGCLHGGGEAFDAQCIAGTCLADPDSHDAQYMLETYGLHQINNDKAREARVFADGDLVIWQTDSDMDTGHPNDDLVAYRFSTASLLPIAVGEYYLFSLARLSGEEVVHGVEPQPGAPDYGIQGSWMMLWNASTGESRRLDVPLGGSQEPYAFDGTWVVFWNRGSTNETENAFWALNTDDGRLQHIYTRVPREGRPDGTRETLIGFHVTQGRLYYLVSQTDKNHTFNHDTYYLVTLEDGNSSVFYETSDPLESKVGLLMGNDRYLAGMGQSIFVFDIDDDEPSPDAFDAEPNPAYMDFNEKYIYYLSWYYEGYDLHKHVYLKDYRSGEEKKVISVGRENPELHVDGGAMVDERLILSIARTRSENFESSVGGDLYWIEIEDVLDNY